MRESSMELPTGYHLERVPDMLVLRRHDGVMVGAFSPRGVTSEAVRRTVEEIARQELREPDTPDSEAPNRSSPDAVPSKLRARFSPEGGVALPPHLTGTDGFYVIAMQRG